MFFLIFYFLFQNNQNYKDSVISDIGSSYNFEDEIETYCKGLTFNKSQENKFYNLDSIHVDIENSREYYTNLIEIIVSNDIVIQPRYKKPFNSKITFMYKNNTFCTFNGEVRLSGDWSDHIDSERAIASLDVKLLNGNIDGITKFKLFLPETRNYENEIFVATFMQELGFISPRTSFVNLKMDNYQGNEVEYKNFIFQEKFSKELIEYYQYREAPLLEVDEQFRWNKIIENNFTEENIKYFLPAKVLNKYWGRKNIKNEEITINGIQKLNQAIFNSNQPWTQLNYNYLGDRSEILYMFDAALMALDSAHSITNHQRKFYFNKIENQFYPIYYDGDSLFLTQSREFETRYDYENFKGLSEGASKILKTLDINIDLFNEKLKNRGVKLSNEELRSYLEIFIKNLNSIKNENITNTQKGNNYLVSEYPKRNLNLPNNEIKLIFFNSVNKIAEVCEINLVKCEELKIELLDYDIFSQKSIFEEFNGVLFGKEKNSFLTINEFNEKTLDKVIIDEVELINLGKNKLDINKKQKIINIEIINPEGRILIKGPGNLSDWKINLFSNLEIKQTEIRIDENLLTGCLTVYDVNLNNTSFSASQKICEDSINIIRSRGEVKDIFIMNSISDGLDIDFSELAIENINVKSSENDCIDLSSGNYNIKNIDVGNCSDKGISVGEKSNVQIDNSIIFSSKIGLAVKDSSILEINNFKGEANQMCVALYRKKQEFGPSFVKINNIKCAAFESDYIQEGSELIYGNK